MARLLLAAPAAYAGSYTVTYSGGIFSNSGDKDYYTESYSVSSANSPAGSYGDSGGNTADYYGDDTPADTGGSGEITATFTWQPGYPGEQPPSCAILQQSSDVLAASDGMGTGFLDDGFGDTASVPEPGGKELTKTQYSAKSSPGPSFPAKCSPSADSGGVFADVNASVGYTAAAYPVTIVLTGTTKDSNHQDNILVGQHCTSSLSGIPSNCTVSNYQWGVTGTTFQGWTVSSDQSHTTEVDGPGRSDQPTAAWYWNDNLGSGNSKVEQVTCTATVTPPDGQGSPFTVTASQPVTVWVPSWSCIATGGTLYVLNESSGDGPIYLLAATSANAPPDVGGMQWSGITTSPSPLFQEGTTTMVQLVIKNLTFSTDDTEKAQLNEYEFSDNGVEGLDTYYPYPKRSSTQGTPSDYFAASDSPYLNLTPDFSAPGVSYELDSAGFHDEFEDYLLYTPPGSSQCVPVGRFVWKTDGDVSEPFLNDIYSWANYGSASVGTVSPSGNKNFVQTNAFPMWTQNSGTGFGEWIMD